MSQTKISDTELEAYLDESLDGQRMAEIERMFRQRPELLQRLAQINGRRNSGIHTLSEIWRRHQIGVPTREELGSYLLGVLPEEHASYIRFRVETLKCRFTIAKLKDLQDRQREGEKPSAARRRRFFQSSAGYLKD